MSNQVARSTLRDVTSAMRRQILDVEEQMRARPDAVGPEAFVTRHHFAPGQYAREIELPKGSRVVGKIHKHAHVNVISRGRVIVWTEAEGRRELEAPATFISSPGTKRVVIALEDTVWTTVHVTEKTGLAEIEADIIAPTFAALEEAQ